MSTPVARLADALKVADDKNPADNERDHYLWLAHAAIEALQLTEEWTWSWSETLTLDGKPGYGFSVSSREGAEAEADSYMTIVSRLVGPWRTAEEKP